MRRLSRGSGEVTGGIPLHTMYVRRSLRWASGKRRRHFRLPTRVEIENDLVENAIRPTTIGKKNWLFMGDADAGERGAIIYTVIESCRRRGIDPYAYLKDLFTRLPKMTNHQIPEIIPSAWAKAHLQVQRQIAS